MNRREALRTLAAGSAAGALAGGVALVAMPSAAEASADPCLAFVNGWNDVSERLAHMHPAEFKPFYDAEVVPYEHVAAYGVVPAATSPEGAIAALRKALAFQDMDRQDANLIRAALAYLEGAAA